VLVTPKDEPWLHSSQHMPCCDHLLADGVPYSFEAVPSQYLDLDESALCTWLVLLCSPCACHCVSARRGSSFGGCPFTMVAKLVYGAMRLDQVVTIALYDMHVHCHMVRHRVKEVDMKISAYGFTSCA
jgi:hypothetical protein